MTAAAALPVVPRPRPTAPVPPAVWTELTDRVAAAVGYAGCQMRAIDPRGADVPDLLRYARAACLTGPRAAAIASRCAMPSAR